MRPQAHEQQGVIVTNGKIHTRLLGAVRQVLSFDRGCLVALEVDDFAAVGGDLKA